MQRHPLDPQILSESLLGVTELASLPRTTPAVDPSVRALVVADDPLVRSAFEQRLNRHAVGASSGDQIAAEVRRTGANVVLWDAGPEDASKAALADFGVPVVAMSSTPDSGARLLALGARGVVRRDAEVDAIIAALTVVRHGLQVVDPTLTNANTFGRARLGADAAPSESLTTREVQVLELVATGMSNKQVAAKLGISAHTVKFHVNAILSKLDVHTRTEAVVRGVQLGVVVV